MHVYIYICVCVYVCLHLEDMDIDYEFIVQSYLYTQPCVCGYNTSIDLYDHFFDDGLSAWVCMVVVVMVMVMLMGGDGW